MFPPIQHHDEKVYIYSDHSNVLLFSLFLYAVQCLFFVMSLQIILALIVPPSLCLYIISIQLFSLFVTFNYIFVVGYISIQYFPLPKLFNPSRFLGEHGNKLAKNHGLINIEFPLLFISFFVFFFTLLRNSSLVRPYIVTYPLPSPFILYHALIPHSSSLYVCYPSALILILP